MPLPSRVKAILRPLGRARFVVERLRYHGVNVLDPQSTNDLIGQTLARGTAQAIGKIGATELAGVRHYLDHRDGSGICRSWGKHQTTLYRNAGVFPADPVILSRFCQRYLDALSKTDALAIWYRWGERAVTRQYAPRARYVSLTGLEPYYHDRPWSSGLAGKRVLVVTPFAATLKTQYEHRQAVWATKPTVLPTFTLEILKVPFSAALVRSEFRDWFAALEYFQQEMEQRSFDVAIIGAGAWSLPLAVRAKRLGKWAIHLGGPTQILFGIRGRRWDASSSLVPLYNGAWVRPSDGERPSHASQIEDGCYW